MKKKLFVLLIAFLILSLSSCNDIENEKKPLNLIGELNFSGDMEDLTSYFNKRQDIFLSGIVDKLLFCEEESIEVITNQDIQDMEEYGYEEELLTSNVVEGCFQDGKRKFEFRYQRSPFTDSCDGIGCPPYEYNSGVLIKEGLEITDREYFLPYYYTEGEKTYDFNTILLNISPYLSNLYATDCAMYEGMIGGLKNNRISLGIIKNSQIHSEFLTYLLDGLNFGYHNNDHYLYLTNKDDDNLYIEALSVKYDIPECDYYSYGDNLTKIDYNLNPLVYYGKFQISIKDGEVSLIETGAITINTNTYVKGENKLPEMVDGIDGLCGVDINEIRNLGNGFYAYKDYVLVQGFDLTKLIILHTSLRGDVWGAEGRYIDSNSFEILKTLNGEEMTLDEESQITMDKSYLAKDEYGEYIIGIQNCYTCAREVGDNTVYVTKKIKNSNPNFLPKYIPDYRCGY